MWA
ncbi:hypothetical protein LINPERPRIM_LOCUS15027 [Linum perenne]|jgi:hypothetical protein